MNSAEHRAKAEAILHELPGQRHAEWVLANATRALAHATLAGLLESPAPVYSVDLRSPIHRERFVDMSIESAYGNFSGADELPQVIAFQGDAVRTSDPCGDPYTRGHVAELHAELG